MARSPADSQMAIDSVQSAECLQVLYSGFVHQKYDGLMTCFIVNPISSYSSIVSSLCECCP